MSAGKIFKNAQNKYGEYQLKLFGDFLTQHNAVLERLSILDLNGNDPEVMDANPSSDFNQFYCVPESCSYYLTKRNISPILLDNSLNREHISKFQLVKTDKVLNKIILTFHQLCDESEDACKMSDSVAINFLYLNEDLCTFDNYLYNSGAPNEKCFLKISKSLKFLCSIQYLIQHCIIVSTTILRQLAALFMSDADVCLNNIQLQPVFKSLGKLLQKLIIFDEIFANSNFLKFWSSYKKTIDSMSGNQQILTDFPEAEINGLMNVLHDLECRLFTGNLYQNFLDSMYKIKQQLKSKAIGMFSNQFLDYIRNNLSIIGKYPADLSELQETEIFVETNALCVLYHNFFGQIDQKYVKQLIEFNSKYPGITLIGNIIWCPEHFLRKHVETLVKSFDKYFNDATKSRQVYLNTKIQNLRRDVRSYCIQISLWAMHMKAFLRTTICDLKSENFKQSSSLFLQGIQFAGQLSHMIKSITNLHILLRIPMQNQCITAICKLIEYLKVIQQIFANNVEYIVKIIQCVVQYLQYKGLLLITSAKKQLESEMYSDRNLDALSALQIAEKCLCGTSSSSRITLANIAVSASNPNTVFSSDYKKFQKIISRFELLSQLKEKLDFVCDPSFMYWNQSTLLINIKNNIDQTNPKTFNYLLAYSDDCSKFLKSLNIDHLELSDEMKKNNYEKYKTEILDKLCVQTEIFLRIEVHADFQIRNKLNPYTETIYDYRDLIRKFKIQMNGNHMVLKDSIEDYFSNTFYNLTTISLHDWKTYGEMRHLAQTKFDLYSIEDYLPNQTLEQGIDVLEIMRNIHVFVSRYRYNMNNQIFVEQISKSKHLNTIGIQQIANSLRTHGTGILNTSVNFTYQFLRRKFYTFSQFLYDEQIRSRLMKDLKYLRDNSEKLNQTYPYERADNFNKGIRKLGLMPGGQSYLDLFRQLITQIGNAMGYIRLIRSGGIHANYNASVFLPKLKDTCKLLHLSEESNLSEVTITSAENLEENIKNIYSNVSKKTEYFNLLLDAFSSSFQNSKNIHLKTFYLIIPPLTINFVEYILTAKDKLHKNDKGGALFFDDGFAIGLTYILKLLNQITDFNTLHWFKAVKQKFDSERVKIAKQQEILLQNNAPDEKLQQTLSLTEKRIRAYETEFNLLYYNLSSSKIFFQ